MSCFSIGEYFNNRRIVALTYTECMLIPRYWLLQKNIGNIWNRIQQYLTTHIPNTKQVFKQFVQQRKWLKHRRELVDDKIKKRRIINNNILTNVPYFIRMNEGIDI